MQDGARLRRPLVLVVDDFADIRESCAEYLELCRFHAVTAVDGLDAVAKAAEYLPDLILMDLAMPELDGRGATRRLKRDPRTCDIPVLVVTAETADDLLEHVLADGCVGLMTKPVPPDQLVARIREVLAARVC